MARNGGLRWLRRLSKVAFLGCSVACLHAPRVTAADYSCCADLDARIAELEATAARSGTSKVPIGIGGTLNYAILSWDDGLSGDAYVVDNQNYATSLEIAGFQDIADSDWYAGFVLEISPLVALSSDVSQVDGMGSRGVDVGESYLWISNDSFGQLAWGRIGGSSDVDNATEMDLSETRVAGYSGVEDVGGGFHVVRTKAKGRDALTPVAWGDLIDHLAGVDGLIARYDTPNVRGLGG